MSSRLLIVAWLALLAFVQAGCRSVPSAPGPASAAADERRARAHAHYAQGVLHELEGRTIDALEAWHQAALLDPGNTELTLDVARRWLMQKQPARALELLERAAARPAAPAPVFVLMGTSQFALGRTNLAEQASRRAVAREPRLLAGHLNLHTALLKSGRTNDAFKALQAAEAVRQPDAEFLVGLAELYLAHAAAAPATRPHCESRALALVRRADALQPAEIPTRLRVADGFNVLGQADEAARRYQQLLADHPQAPGLPETLRAKLTELYLRGQDRDRALEQLRLIVRDDPANAQAHYYLALLATEQNDAATAEDHLRAVVVLNPQFEQAYYDLALAQLSRRRTNEALATLQTARKKFAPGFVSEFLHGLALANAARYADAVAHYTAAETFARATDPKRLTAPFYFHFGAALERKGDYSGAVEYLEKALALQPDFPAAANYLGYLWAERGENLPRARELIERAVQAEPKNAAYLDSLAWVLFKLGQPREALPILLEAIALAEAEQDFDAALYDHLGDIQAALGNLTEARAAWRKALEHQPEDRAAIERKLAPAR